jgi:hypothetical protein
MPFLTDDRSCRRAAPWALLLAAAMLAAGCGTLDVPRADNYPATGQPKARAVHHWDVLAGDVAARVAQKIAGWPEGEHPIHVRVAESSAFEQGFGKLLAVQLLERGVALSQEPAAVELLVQTQVVQHQAGVRNGLAMPWTRLAAGVGRGARLAPPTRSRRPRGWPAGLALGMAVDMAEQHTQGAARAALRAPRCS